MNGSPLSGRFLLSFDGEARGIDTIDGLGDLRIADDQRRQETDHVVAGADEEQLLRTGRGDELGVGRHECAGPS